MDCPPVYEQKCLKTKMKSSKSNIKTGFRDKEMLRKGPLCICLAAIVLDSVGKTKNYYYPLV